MKHIEQAIRDLLDRGRPLCCLADDLHEAFFMSKHEAANLIQAVLFERATA